ncbi:hypothetical protein CO731_04974 [Aminobacter sp. MSH1]|uniref:DUF6074 family protein n=1 Tax=Aminobacter sp. MSH1 TaxID=374606 RepID=UPI000D3CFE13|nr:DUF6074 family protein [Aminobacter sp. MSH1]AWC25477.1 hypothetical protein CO731_04974 [Aminobacter sp. MSH1]
MVHDTLPLFAWQPRPKVLLFPLTRRVGKVRHTAAKLAGKHGEDAELYWKQVVAANRKHLERVGLSEDQISDELRSLFDAVQGELHRLAYQRQTPGGAA